MIRHVARAGSLAAVSSLLLAASCIQAQASQVVPAAHGWQLVKVLGTNANNLDPASGDATTSALAASGPDNAWSLWENCNWPCNGGTTPITERWNGHRWSAVPASELAGMTAPVAVTTSSATDTWLFSWYQKAPAYALHWNGTAWSRHSLPTWVVRFNLSGTVEVQTADFGHGNVWVFSLGDGSFKKTVPFAAHLVKGQWRKSFMPIIPNDVDAQSPGNIWAVGTNPNLDGKPILTHWNGRKWRTMPLPTRWPGAPAGGVLGTSASSLWLGWYKGQVEWLLHWNGRTWSRVSLPKGFDGYPLISDGRGGMWLGGASLKGTRRPFLHYYRGKWNLWLLPTIKGLESNSVQEMMLVPGTTSVWAIGHGYEWVKSEKTSLNRGTIWRFTP